MYVAAKVIYNATHIHFMVEGPLYGLPILYFRVEIVATVGDLQKYAFSVSTLFYEYIDSEFTYRVVMIHL